MSFSEAYPNGSPHKFADDLYYDFSEFESLTTNEIKKCCDITLKRLMIDCSSEMRTYYDLCRTIIKKKGTIL